MRHRQLQLVDAAEEHALSARRHEPHPAILKFSRLVCRERRHGSCRIAGEQQLRLEQNLKAVADAEDQFACVAESLQHIGQVVANLVAEDPAGRDVVAVAETAREAEDLKVGRLLRYFEQPIYVPPLGRSTGEREGMRSLLVAIRAGRSQD
jgi:hypothetical protein